MNNSAKTIVPIHLDGLFVPTAGTVDTVVPLVDFSRLGEEILYLGEELTSLPFTPAQNTGKLDAGVHLHWALPDALTKTTGMQLVALQSFVHIFGVSKGNAVWQTLTKAAWIQILPQHSNMAKVLVARQNRTTLPAGIGVDDISAVNNILDQPAFPSVPNRWLISRFSVQDKKPVAQWMVESDYVWPAGAQTDNYGRNLSDNYTTYPFRATDTTEILEYRFVGRWYNVNETPSSSDSYLPDALTALGYGEPNFAAFYPSCRTVFGFLDVDNTNGENHFTYELLGWYSDAQKDYYQLFIAAFMATLPAEDPYMQLLEAVKEEFKWFIPIQVGKADLAAIDANAWDLLIKNAWLEDVKNEAASLATAAIEAGNTLGIENADREMKIRAVLNKLIQDQLPASTLFFARLDQNNQLPNSALQNMEKVSLAIGNTAAEAMSAFLASKIAPDQPARDLVEDYLEALQLEPQITGQQIDLSAKFQQARHQNGFSAVNGGTIWSVRPINKTSQASSAVKQAEDARKANDPYSKIEDITLPDDLSDLLNEMNIRQLQLDQYNDQITSLQQQIFADWSAYLKMQRMYTAGVAGGNSSSGDPDSQNNGASNQDGADDPEGEGQFTDGTDWEGNFRAMHDFMDWEISTSLNALQANAAKCTSQLQSLQTILQNKLIENKLTDKYELKATAAPRYWQPTEPVLLLTDVKATDRHGQDGRMRADKLLYCETAALTDNPTQHYDEYAAALQSVDFPFTDSSKDWHPIMLDWKIEFRQTRNSGEDEQYTEDYLEANYNLDLNAVEFTSKASETDLSIPFWGRSILTPSGSLAQKDVIIRKLVPDITTTMKAEGLAKTDVDGVKEWLTSKAITDAALLSIIENPAYTQTGEWVAARLSGIFDDQLSGIIAWYQQKVADNIQSSLGLSIDADQIGAFVQKMMDEKPLRDLYYSQQVNKTPDDQQTDFYLQQDKDFVPWLKNKMGNAWQVFFSSNTTIQQEPDEGTYASDNFDTMITWYQNFARECLHKVLACQAYLGVYKEEGLSQSLGGFNNALLNISQSYQLNIADPDEQYKGFAQKVRDAVKQQNGFTKGSSGDFSPLRAGNIRFTNLSLINNFGQMQPVDLSNDAGKNIVKAAGMRSLFADEIELTPRLVQPARLSFRWLSAHPSSLPDDLAGKYLTEMNSHPASSPICGWLMTNNLDKSIMCYDHNGAVLGYIDTGGAWRIFPGRDTPAAPTDIENEHLAELIGRLCRLGATANTYVANLIDTIDTALDNIEPANSAQQDALALLIGRPLAIVRATFGLEQKGLSATFQRSSPSDPELLNDLTQFLNLKKNAGTTPVSPDDFKRNTLNYDAVKIPIRVGEYRQLNDGLIGCWINQRQDLQVSDTDRDVFYAPQSSGIGETAGGLIFTHHEDGAGFEFNLQFNKKEPFEITMLLDVTGKVHATCGLLPVKSLEIPPDHYKQSLANIEAGFLTAPLLTLPGRLHISLPREPGYGWSWVEKDGADWKTISYESVIGRKDVQNVFGSNANKIWDALISNGWLETTDDNNIAKVVATESRKNTLLTGIAAEDVQSIEQMLERTHINPFDASASFSGATEIREGWLRLNVV